MVVGTTVERVALLCPRPWALEPGFKGDDCNNAHAVVVVQIFLGRSSLRRLVPGRASRDGAKRRAFSFGGALGPWPLRGLRPSHAHFQKKDVRPHAARPVRLTARGRFVSREAASNRARNLFHIALKTLRYVRVGVLRATFCLRSTRLRL